MLLSLVQGALRLLLVCILGLQGTSGDSWDIRPALKAVTAGHRLSPSLLLPPWLPLPHPAEPSAALRSQRSNAQLEREHQAAAQQDAPASSRKLLQRLNYENPNYHPSPPPPIPPPPPSPPPSPPSPPAQTGTGTVPWQGTLQGITSALGMHSLSCCKVMMPFEGYILLPQPKLRNLRGTSSGVCQIMQGRHVQCNMDVF